MSTHPPRSIAPALGLLALLAACAPAPEQRGGARPAPAQDPPTAPPPARAKKLIEWGWDEPDTAFLRENVERMEQLPFDGLVLHALSSEGGNLAWEIAGSRRFELDEFAAAIADLQATPFRRLTDRFLRVNVTPGTLDWFDDDAWAVVQHNFGVAAALAERSGCKGLLFDTEQYREASLFDYRKQAQRDTKSFEQYGRKVRRRGEAWMREVSAAFPDVVVILTFGYRIAQPREEGQERSDVRYGLLADFLDGVLDGCWDKTRIVDGWEHSYAYKRQEQFEQAYETIRTTAPSEWSGHPAQYRRHVEAGFGLWMDQDWRRLGWSTIDFTTNYFTPAEFESAVRSALRVSDEYVWIYTEQPRWWTDERLPQAYVEALAAARSAEAGASPQRD